MQRQEQIKKEKKYDEEDEELDMKEFVKDIQGMHQRVNLETNMIHEQDQKLVGVNDKLDDYNEEMEKADELMNIVNKGPLGLLKDKFVGLFKSNKNEKIEKLNKNDKNVIEEARNYNDHKELDNEWTLVQNDQSTKVININKHKGDGQDDILDEAIEEVKGMRKAVQNLNSAAKDSIKLVDATNNNMDTALNNVNKVNKKMKKHK